MLISIFEIEVQKSAVAGDAPWRYRRGSGRAPRFHPSVMIHNDRHGPKAIPVRLDEPPNTQSPIATAPRGLVIGCIGESDFAVETEVHIGAGHQTRPRCGRTRYGLRQEPPFGRSNGMRLFAAQ